MYPSKILIILHKSNVLVFIIFSPDYLELGPIWDPSLFGTSAYLDLGLFRPGLLWTRGLDPGQFGPGPMWTRTYLDALDPGPIWTWDSAAAPPLLT